MRKSAFKKKSSGTAQWVKQGRQNSGVGLVYLMNPRLRMLRNRQLQLLQHLQQPPLHQ